MKFIIICRCTLCSLKCVHCYFTKTDSHRNIHLLCHASHTHNKFRWWCIVPIAREHWVHIGFSCLHCLVANYDINTVCSAQMFFSTNYNVFKGAFPGLNNLFTKPAEFRKQVSVVGYRTPTRSISCSHPHHHHHHHLPLLLLLLPPPSPPQQTSLSTTKYKTTFQ